MFSNLFVFKNLAINEVMWKNTVESDRVQMKIWRMRIECWLTNATLKMCSNYCFFPLQHWLYTRTGMLRYTYDACLF
jgi:hypothetical protein